MMFICALVWVAVEKAVMFAQLMSPGSVQHNQVILTALAHMLCFLIGSLGNITPQSCSAPRSTVLDTIKDSAIKVMPPTQGCTPPTLLLHARLYLNELLQNNFHRSYLF